MARPKQLSNPEFGRKVSEYLNIAYKDYLAARVLLHAGLLSQGAVLASTAIEKYFKAILAFRGNEAPGHLSKRHINSAKNFDNSLCQALSDSFLTLLQKAYRLRYLDNLPVDYNIVIAYREFLAELDFTAITIQESFNIKLNGVTAKFMYHIDREAMDGTLFFNNHLLLNQRKQDFISAEAQAVYELRNCRLRGFMEVSYISAARVSDGQFLREGFSPVDQSCMQYQVALAPIVESIAGV